MREALQRYPEGGLEKLKEGAGHPSTRELEASREVLAAGFRARPPPTIAEAADRLEKLTGLRRLPPQVCPFLKRLGMKRLRVKSIPSQGDGEKQAKFLEEQIESRLEEAQQGKRHVFFLEGAYFVWLAFVGFLGALPRGAFRRPADGRGWVGWGRGTPFPTK